MPALARGRYDKRRLEMPVLIATGRHDPVVTPERIRGAEPFAPDLRVEVIEGAGHFTPEEAPEQVAQLLAEHVGARTAA
jgi:pimeloyl-ACP methyl ester carboxylesterase